MLFCLSKWYLYKHLVLKLFYVRWLRANHLDNCFNSSNTGTSKTRPTVFRKKLFYNFVLDRSWAYLNLIMQKKKSKQTNKQNKNKTKKWNRVFDDVPFSIYESWVKIRKVLVNEKWQDSASIHFAWLRVVYYVMSFSFNLDYAL